MVRWVPQQHLRRWSQGLAPPLPLRRQSPAAASAAALPSAQPKPSSPQPACRPIGLVGRLPQPHTATLTTGLKLIRIAAEAIQTSPQLILSLTGCAYHYESKITVEIPVAMSGSNHVCSGTNVNCTGGIKMKQRGPSLYSTRSNRIRLHS